jgi:hypothetical protein
MIVVGLIAHGESPSTIPTLEPVAHLVVGVNARISPEPTPWLGFGANHNRLIDDYGEAEWYVALNPDVDISADQLYTLIEHADAYGYALAGPLRREPWGVQGYPSASLPSPKHFFRASFRSGRLSGRRGAGTGSNVPMTDAAWLAGSCIAIRADLLRELRFDERYFMYFEDADLSQRARRCGARIGVCTAVTIRHASGWQHDDALMMRRGVEYARSALLYAEIHGYSPRKMKMATLAWTLPRAVMPWRSADERVASRAIAEGLVCSGREGIAELATLHNERFGFWGPPFAVSDAKGSRSC